MSLEPRRYLTHDCDQGRVELVVQAGGNGDWYVSIVPESHRIARLAGLPGETPRLHSCVRVTTSGERREHHGAAAAVAALYRAMGGEGVPDRYALTDAWGWEQREQTLREERDRAHRVIEALKHERAFWVTTAGDRLTQVERAREEAAAWRALAKARGEVFALIWLGEPSEQELTALAKLRAIGIDPDAPEGT